MLPKDSAKHIIVRHLSSYIPRFDDIFDEETFYIFAFFVVVVTILGAFILSRYITIKDVGHVD